MGLICFFIIPEKITKFIRFIILKNINKITAISL